jgi:hypothetical protein
MAAGTREKPSRYLLTLQQRSNETLKDFMARLNLEKMAVEDHTDDMVFVALYQGLFPEGPLMKKLVRKQPSTLQGLIDKVEEFINQEETLKAMDTSRQPHETPQRRRRNSKRWVRKSQN